MSNQAKIKTKLVAVGFAPILSETKEKTTYGNPIYFAAAEAGGREYSISPVGEVKKVSANSQQVYACEQNGGYDITLTLLAVIDDIEKNWLGKTIAKNGVLEINNNVELPKFALILSDQSTDNIGKTEILYRCSVSARPSTNGATEEDGTFEFQFPEYSISATPRINDNYVKFTIPGVAELGTIPEPILNE